MSRPRRLARIESLESRQLMAADLAAAEIVPLEPAAGGDWFIADSFSFGVEREMKESGEKGGTTDINIGVGELQECTISKSMDRASGGDSGGPLADSFSFGVEREMKESGEKGGTTDINIGVGELQECTISKSMDWASADLALAEVGADAGDPVCYLKYKLDRCFVKSWSTSGDADDRPTEEVALNAALAQFAINGNSPGTAVIDFVEVAGGDADDRPTEEVAFYYNKI